MAVFTYTHTHITYTLCGFDFNESNNSNKRGVPLCRRHDGGGLFAATAGFASTRACGIMV